jgi:Transposase DDE domain
MKQISELGDILNGYFQWNKARISFFSQMLLALIVSRTVNLNKIACVIPSEAEQASRYRRLQRFFAEFTIDFDRIAGFVFQLFFLSGGKWYLTIDRTNWRWGKTDINILTLAIAFKGIAIPIYWDLLDSKGNSDTSERIALLQKFINQFGKDCIAGLLADREFIGTDWFKWLLQESMPFYIRIKKNMLTTNTRGQEVPVEELFRGLKPMEERLLYNKRKIMNHDVYVTGLKLSNGDLLIVATNELPGDAIKKYALRWEIETLFSCLKGRGFNFEETHIIHKARIKKLLVLLAIAFCWAHKTGEWRHEFHPIKIKKHGRPAISLFRYGLDYIIDIITNVFCKEKLFENCLSRIRPHEPDLEAVRYCT